MAKQTQLSDSIVTSNPAKFSLYLKNREIKEIAKALEYIMLLPEGKREEWVKEHGEFMNEAFNDFLDQSSATFDADDNAQFDDEMLELSQDLVVSLQDTFTRVHTILSKNKLKS